MAEFDGALGLRGWQYLFIFEGIPPIVLGILAYTMLSNRPSEAGWLSPREREIIVSRIEGEEKQKRGYGKASTFLDALKNPALYLLLI